VARAVAGTQNVIDTMRPFMGSEDFAHMLKKRPGAYILIGNGNSAGLHNNAYNFNDEAIPYGVSYLARLAETAMPA
jgi:hippurate hydrolase